MEQGEFRFERMPEAYPTGGYKCTLSEETIQRQSGAVWDMLKQFGFLALSSFGGGGGDKDLIGISLPVRIFEPRSYLQRVVDGFWSAPIYLKTATDEVQAGNHLEVFKNVITFVISGLHATCSQEGKPFNPILGETYQAKYEDGTDVFCEQSSHHPPITNVELVGPNNKWRLYGYGEWKAALKITSNYVEGWQKGPLTLEFFDGTKVTFSLPKVFFRGLVKGDRVIEYEGTIRFEDKKNDLVCDLTFNPPDEQPQKSGWMSGMFSSKPKRPPSDYVKGVIVGKGGKQVSKVEGTWMGSLEFDGKKYWNYKDKHTLYKPTPVEDPLPSDSRFRQDLSELEKGDIDSAQEWKNKLEAKQRREKGWRTEGKEIRQKMDGEEPEKDHH